MLPYRKRRTDSVAVTDGLKVLDGMGGIAAVLRTPRWRALVTVAQETTTFRSSNPPYPEGTVPDRGPPLRESRAEPGFPRAPATASRVCADEWRA
jgi:hypothetical protein